MKEVIERCNWLVNKCKDKVITPDVKDDVRYLLEEIERLKEENNFLCSIANGEKEKEDRILELINRISKAIEYIEDENIDITTIRFNDIQDVKKDLLDILKGDDKE